MAASVWVYVQRVLIPYQVADAVAHGRPRGVLSDLYPRWVGTRELLFHGKDPYSSEVTRQIQTGYYGRPLDPSRPDDPRDEQRFAYPVYVVFYLAPIAKLPFSTVRQISAWALGVLTGISLLLWLRAIYWRISRSGIAIWLLLVLSSVAAVQGIKLQQLSLVVAALLAGCAALLVEQHLVLAGILLALATVKPQVALLPALWLLLWTFSNWRERQNFFWGFLAGMTALFAASEYVLPGWLPRFVDAIIAYRHYAGGSLTELFAPAGAAAITLGALLALAAVCWRARLAPAESPPFMLALALALAVTVILFSILAPYNQVLLLPTVLLIMRQHREFWEKHRLRRVAFTVAAIFVLWPWAASMVLAPASFLVPAQSIQKAWAVPLWSSIGVPILILPLLSMLLVSALRDERSALIGLNSGPEVRVRDTRRGSS